MTKLIYKPIRYNNLEFTEVLIEMTKPITNEQFEEPKKYDCNTTIWHKPMSEMTPKEIEDKWKELPSEEYRNALKAMDLTHRDTLMFGRWEDQAAYKLSSNAISQESPMEFRKGMQWSMPTINTYMYNGAIYRWIDGDTVEVVLDLGLKIAHRTVLRLYGLNAPEKNTDEGKQLIEHLNNEFPFNSDIIVQTIKDKKEKYGRYLGIVHSKNVNINEYLISKKFAKILNY